MTLTVEAPEQSTETKTTKRRRRRTSVFAHGEPMVWLTGGSLGLCLLMIAGLLALVLYQGGITFWPRPLLRLDTVEGRSFMGELSKDEVYTPGAEVFEALPEEIAQVARERVAANGGVARRRLLRTGNFQLTNAHFDWVDDFLLEEESYPEWALLLEREAWGRFYGLPQAFVLDGEVVSEDPAQIWELFGEHHPDVLARLHEKEALESEESAQVNRRLEHARLSLRSVELSHGEGSPEWLAEEQEFLAVQAECDAEFARIREVTGAIDSVNDQYAIAFTTAEGYEKTIGLASIVRAYPPNQLSLGAKLSIYFSRWKEFLVDDPREANSEGGVFPAIFGTVMMTMIMTLFVVPFGILAALYLREYAKQGPLVSIVRIAVNNLAGVPSIVFGVFGLGFFCYIIGAGIDETFFAAHLPNPTFGKGGLLWASLTLALLTLPVVIVATEEAVSAVPSSMREGSYACGATKWQTIRRIVLPRALPGIMTGIILAIARGAGEVAPLMLVGAVKLAPELPVDWEFPFGAQRSFMHLGFHIYDVGFQSQNSEAARPMVFTTTLLLLAIVVALNVVAIGVRTRLRRRFVGV